jgi:lipopolysaccharide/colanic/teichoic acid biosynthesis glycosyltransferase
VHARLARGLRARRFELRRRSQPPRRLRRHLLADEIPAALRALDLVLVLFLAPFALVAGLLLALAVFIDSPGPVLYRSRRIGRGGRPFDMFKFRTMVRDAAGPPVSARGDQRYTPLGHTLASSRLDELPQLWNVICGDMRLVGPRPELEDFVREFPCEYERILSVPPGLTGPAQVEYAWEGEILAKAQEMDRARLYRESILPQKLVIDLGYVESHSVRGDLVLLARTLALPAVRAWRHIGEAGAAAARWRLASGALLCVATVALAALLAAQSTTPF